MPEPTLRYETAYVIDCHDLDRFVAIHLEGYGATWRSLDTDHDGYHNGSYENVTVDFGDEIEDDIDQDFNRWLMGSGPFYLDVEGPYSHDLPSISHMMQWLCNIGKIPPGQYVVQLWW